MLRKNISWGVKLYMLITQFDIDSYLPRSNVGDDKLYFEVELVQLMKQNTCQEEVNNEGVLKMDIVEFRN